jgi:hypothetical protein
VAHIGGRPCADTVAVALPRSLRNASMPRIAPHIAGGVCGMFIVAALVVAQELLARGGGNLSPLWLALLLAPGVLAAHMEHRRNPQDEDAPDLAGLRAGIVTAHFAAPLLLALLIIAVATTDWTDYAARVGLQTATAVRDALLPGTAAFGLIAVLLAYAGCAAASLLGALSYMATWRFQRQDAKTRRIRQD